MNRIVRSTVLAAASFAVASCEIASDLVASSRTGAEFRFVARGMYRSLFQPSCEPSPDFSRADMLNNERQAVSEFERSISGTPASEHISIAKADAELEAGCWADDDPRFALIHVNMTKEDVRGSLARMRELAPRLRSLALTPASTSEGREFRRGVRGLIEAIRPQCPLVSGASNDQVLLPVRERMNRFERELSGSELAVQFDVAEADVAFEQSVTVVECGMPEAVDDLALARREALANVEHLIAAL